MCGAICRIRTSCVEGKENLMEPVSKKMEMAALCCVYLCVGAQTFKSRNVCRRKRLLEFILEE